MNVPNAVTAATFLVSFFTAGSWENDIKNGAALISLRTFVRSSAFIIWMNHQNADACKLEYFLRKHLSILWFVYALTTVISIHFNWSKSILLEEYILSFMHLCFHEIFFSNFVLFIEILFINITYWSHNTGA